ncbi:FdhF/YdeP family oxidoreductase [Microvirga pudoricolor]|uniref:FdhF/YdeP family oxidoreductase n=1 Tax=Microvirga pudoricolor TaxID=2778729 RepID=UPI00194F1D3C|nr:FdhF/YdeP family oxidoreductase [Microvirga pudoricolor]MBM6592455.1 FdhF/YdeP family oxidoreductase [Microvirga pudoricolor]
MQRDDETDIQPYEGPAGGWGSAKSLGNILQQEEVPVKGSRVLWAQNKPDGFMCVSCAWAKPADHHPFEFCENGAKATAWEITDKRCTPDFFREHTLSDLRGWSDFALEEQGRLTEPMRYDAQTDTYRPVSWAEAFAEIGRELQAVRAADPKKAVFYASGRASLEASYMYGLLARLYGNNNLPDSSNMCHETTSVALPESIGAPVGTVLLDDFEKTDLLFFFGQNVGSNSPRMLHDLQQARRRGANIITFNPLRERGLERFTNPQSPAEMAAGIETKISTQYHQVKAAGDIAAIMGICKTIFALDDDAKAAGKPRVLDVEFLEAHAHGLDAFEAAARAADWHEIEKASGLRRAEIEAAGRVYARSEAVIGVYGMGLTQHQLGVQTVQMLVNLLLLRGNIGKPGAGICPVRGHSNVQGQRTVGITEKPALVPNEKLKELYGFEPPQENGLNTVEACEAILKGEVLAFVGLGGNFVRAIPETRLMEEAWGRMRLTVQVATKLNRSHLVHGEIAYLLPCLGRIEYDRQATGEQAVSMEDSTTCIHGSWGQVEPASTHLLSEPRIVAELAKATLPPNPRIDWDAWVGDYARIRDAIEATYPDQFKDFNKRLFKPGGFPRPVAARYRTWKTETGKANFKVPEALTADGIDIYDKKPEALRLITLRSNDQFNTTVYGYDDRFRGIRGTRDVVLMNTADMQRFGLAEGDIVRLETAVDDGVERQVGGLRVTAYNVPEGCCGGYYPELNVLIPLWHYARESKVPAAKSVPVLVRRADSHTEAAE